MKFSVRTHLLHEDMACIPQMFILSLIADAVESLCFWMLWKSSPQLLAQQYVPPRAFPSQKASAACFTCLLWQPAAGSWRGGYLCGRSCCAAVFPLSLEELALELEAPSKVQELLDFPLSTTFFFFFFPCKSVSRSHTATPNAFGTLWKERIM